MELDLADLSEDAQAAVLAAAEAEAAVQRALADAAPHAVHVDAPFEDIDPDGDGIPNGRRYVGPADCPDCTRGLVSRGADMVCIQLPLSVAVKGCHEGCIVACGRPR